MTLLDRNPAYPQLVRPTSAYDMDDPERDSYPFDGFQVPGRARQTRFDDLPQGPRDSDGVGGCLVELRSHVQAVVCVSLFHAHSPSPSTGNERYIGCASPGEPPLTARASTWIDWKYQFHSTVERLGAPRSNIETLHTHCGQRSLTRFSPLARLYRGFHCNRSRVGPIITHF